MAGNFLKIFQIASVQSLAQLCPPLCDTMDCSTPGLPVHHQLVEFTQTHVHWVGDAIQLSHPLSPSPPAFSLSQHPGLCQWVSFSHQMAKVLEFQLQHQSFQCIFRTDFLPDCLLTWKWFKDYSCFPSGSALRIDLQCRRHEFDPWIRKMPWRRK